MAKAALRTGFSAVGGPKPQLGGTARQSQVMTAGRGIERAVIESAHVHSIEIASIVQVCPDWCRARRILVGWRILVARRILVESDLFELSLHRCPSAMVR